MKKNFLSRLNISKILWAVYLSNTITIVFIFTFQSFLPPVVPLFYGFPKGQDQLVNSIFLVIPPLSSIIIAIFSTMLTAIIKDDFLKKILLSTSVVITVLSFVTVFKIFILVGGF